jgi:hypothetical protein
MTNRYGAINFADRRSFLRAMGLGAAAAPFVPLLEAQAATVPKRLVIMVGSNGVGNLGQFYPSGDTNNFTMGSTTKSLEPNKKDLICFGNEFDGRIMGGAIPHPEAAGNLLTASAPDSPPTSVDVNTRNQSTRATGPSVDQVIAKQIGKGTAFESLALGCGSESANLLGGSIVYRGAKDPISAEQNCFATFDRLFPLGAATGATGKSVRDGDSAMLMDTVTKSLSSMKGRVGAEDSKRIEAHIESVTALRSRLATLSGSMGGGGGACMGPNAPPRDNSPLTFQTKNPGRFMKEILHVNVDMAVAAMACDLTRVVVFQVGATTAIWAPFFLGLKEQLHLISHQDVANMTKYTAYTIEHGFKYLLDKMKTVGGTGTENLLYNSAVMWSNEFGDGNAHSMASLPIIAAGNAGGKWKTGRYIRFGKRRRHVDFLMSLFRAFDMDVKTFGNDPTGGPINEMAG